jgi:hypothetical protein
VQNQQQVIRGFFIYNNTSQEDNMKKAVAQLILIGITVLTFAAPLLAGGSGGP